MFGFIILGNYYLGIQFLTLLTLIPTLVYQYILPQDASGVSNRKLKILVIMVSAVISFLGILLSPIIIPIFFPKFIDTIQVVQIISLVLIPHSIMLILQSQFLAKLKSRIVLIGNGIFAIIQISSILSLGSILGINGIASGMVLASIGQASFYIISNRKLQKNE